MGVSAGFSSAGGFPLSLPRPNRGSLDVRHHLRRALRSHLAGAGIDIGSGEIALERPRNRGHGDWSTNVALAAAARAGRAPRELAEELAGALTADPPPHVAAVEAAGPGFVNFRLAPSWLHEVLREAVGAGADGYARSEEGSGLTASVEFVSANPTGPLHAGHGRWAAYGDSLCRILQRCGYSVIREFYVNDRGRQTELFGASLAARRRGESPPEDGYAGAYVADWAAEMPDGADPRAWGVERARRDQSDTLASMSVAFDRWTSEQELVDRGAMKAVLAELGRRGLTYERDGAVWLRASDLGDDQDRVLVKSDGEPTYFLPDIAYHHEKFARADLVIDILGADHHGYVGRMRAAMAGLGHDPDRYEVLLGQNVTLVRDGEEVRLSKRAGALVLVSDLLAAVGADATRLVYLLQSIDTTQTIDLDAVSARSSDNPVYYVQYAHARIHSVGRRAADRGIERAPLAEVDLSALTHERERAVLAALAELPDAVLGAARARAPHQVCAWARELAGAFHRFWHDCPILSDDLGPGVRDARLWLVEAARAGLAVGLDLLGASAPERMVSEEA